ncbi:MAG: DUF4954 family protein [Spirochaetes bacterium]|nr:DUF4954 family protein [Spirochaetota bacterium]
MGYRHLKQNEISLLKKQGCEASDWKKILVKDPFSPKHLNHVSFSGHIKIGKMGKKLPFPDGMKKDCGLYHACIHNCEIGDNVYISHVHNLSNYNINNDVVIENCHTVSVKKENTFGNGVKIEVLNEGGGRELILFDLLTSQIAYLFVLYRHNQDLIQNLEKMIDDYVKTKKARIGSIGKGCYISGCYNLININIGEKTVVSGARSLENGTIKSHPDDPVCIGDGVIAKNFIILEGSRIDSAAQISSCFIGQSVKIGQQFSAENSAFFANCEGFHGEAVSLFAGPYTVTHHKSTLLIAALVSFYNAGSGTNQSNHMYKLGPVHQGILERGCKTGSFSYLLWPCRIGAFSVILGKHYSNFDTANLPFSYITERDGKSILSPGRNLFTVGTRRDCLKWPARDRRKGIKRDLIHFDMLNPFTVNKMLNGITILKDLYEKTSRELEYVNYNGINIKRLLLKTTAKYYDMAVRIYTGQSLINRLGDISTGTGLEEIKTRLIADTKNHASNWLDILGMIIPEFLLNDLIQSIVRSETKDIDRVLVQLNKMYSEYAQNEWSWCVGLIERQYNIKIEDIRSEHIIQILKDWKDSVIKFNNMILKDAEKEFDSNARIGFGLDGDSQIKDMDFETVRGTFDKNNFVLQLKEESKKIEEKYDRYSSLLGEDIKESVA